jgi:hypothetical protein
METSTGKFLKDLVPKFGNVKVTHEFLPEISGEIFLNHQGKIFFKSDHSQADHSATILAKFLAAPGWEVQVDERIH